VEVVRREPLVEVVVVGRSVTIMELHPFIQRVEILISVAAAVAVAVLYGSPVIAVGEVHWAAVILIGMSHVPTSLLIVV
jgi:hypothetical protein